MSLGVRLGQRRKYLLDRQWQLTVFRNTAVVAIAAGVVQLFALQLLAGQDPLERWSGEQLQWLALATNGVFLAVIVIGLWLASVRLTHSVVGPAQVIDTAVRNLRRGKFDSRLTLRRRDYLTSLAASVEDLSQHLAVRVETVQDLCTRLTAAIERHDTAQALELTSRLRDVFSPTQPESPLTDDVPAYPEPVTHATSS